LICHRDTPATAAYSIEVEAAFTEFGQMALRYTMRGVIALIEIPKPVHYGSRSDGLWQTTCFEAFIKGDDDAYVEINLSPSTGWAGYSFQSYRHRGELPEIDTPVIDVEQKSGELIVTATVDISNLAVALGANCRIGLSAVIEEIDGTKSYWALAHPPGAPDFHHPACFARQLPAARAP
jgi:hypothetical protein